MFALTLALALTAAPAHRAPHKPVTDTYAYDTRWQGGPLNVVRPAKRARSSVVIAPRAAASPVGLPTAQGMADTFASQMLQAEPGQAVPVTIRVGGETYHVTIVE